MNIKRAKEEIKDTIEAYLLKNKYGEYVIPTERQRPLFLLGAPGIGKTQIMEQVARECKVNLVSYTITHHTRQSAIGLPFIAEREFLGVPHTVTEYTMSEIVASVYEKMEKTGIKEGILFIDEINCVSETLAPAMLQFLQCKTFGNQSIPKGWLIAAAGNPPEYNKSVREFDVVTMDRVKKIEVEPDFQAWKEYAYQTGIHPAVLSYLNTKPQCFYQMETTVDGKMFTTPRGWEDLSRLIAVYEQLGKKIDWEVAVQYLQHPKTARDFASYLELYNKYKGDYQIEQVLDGTIDESLYQKLSHASFDERLSIIGLILARLNEQFRQVQEKYLSLAMLFENLKKWKEGLLRTAKGQALSAIEEGINVFRQEWTSKKEAELLEVQTDHRYLKNLLIMEGWQQDLKKEKADTGEKALERLRLLFGEEKKAYEQIREQAGKMLEHAFDFMEPAFGSSQEMVIFITELNTGYYSIKFLQEYECQRYYEYNRLLLFKENRRRLLDKMKNLEEI